MITDDFYILSFITLLSSLVAARACANCDIRRVWIAPTPDGAIDERKFRMLKIMRKVGKARSGQEVARGEASEGLRVREPSPMGSQQTDFLVMAHTL
jgi:hypothetical protein